MQETAPHYRSIGTLLLKDRYGHRLQAIDMDEKTAADKIREVYVKWLEEDPYSSWATLCECFRECNLHTLAKKIESRFHMVSPPTSPGKIYRVKLYYIANDNCYCY